MPRSTEGLNEDLLDVSDDAMLSPRRPGGLLTQRVDAGRGGAPTRGLRAAIARV